MMLFASEIVADAKNIELELFRDAFQRRNYLIGWFNEHLAAGGLDTDCDPLPDHTTAEQAAMHIEEVIGRPVILSEVYV